MKIYKILILLCLYQTNTVFGATKITDSVVAVVKHHVILDSDIKKNLHIIQYNMPKVDKYLSTTSLAYQEMLNQQITKKLIFDAVQQKNIHLKKNKIKKTIDSILHINNITLNQFQMYLDQIGLNYNKYCSQLSQDILNKSICNHIVHQRAHILPNEIDALIPILRSIDYNKEFKIIHIKIPLPIHATQNQIKITKKIAQSLIKNDKINDNITQLTNTNNSTNYILQSISIKQTKWISWKNMPIIFDQYLPTINTGDVIGPIHTYDGIHILKIRDIRYKKFIFPITKVKIKAIACNQSYDKYHAIKNLLEIKKKVENNNTTFDLITKKESKDYFFIYHKEHLKWYDLDDLEKNIRKNLINLKKNEISMPIHTSFGWCIIQLIDTKNINYSTMIRKRAHYYLLYEKFNTIINDWIKELKSIAYIKITHQND